MQLIMNADRDTYGTLTKDYNRDYLGGNIKYPKTLQDAYNLLKGWNKNEKPGQKYPSKVGASFNTTGEEDGEALVNNGAKCVVDMVATATQWINARPNTETMGECCTL